MSRHLVIFARAPQLGRVKTRLAADIGAAAALRFYRHCLDRLFREVGRDPRWRCWLAATPDHRAVLPRAWRRSRCLSQGRGDLGQRMARAFRELPPGPAVIIGSDIPALCAHHVTAGFRILGRHDAVFGPTPDGGYWLVGFSRVRPLPRAIFAGVRWSSEHALVDTLESLPRGLRVGFAATLEDIDDGAAFRRCRLA